MKRERKAEILRLTAIYKLRQSGYNKHQVEIGGET